MPNPGQHCAPPPPNTAEFTVPEFRQMHVSNTTTTSKPGMQPMPPLPQISFFKSIDTKGPLFVNDAALFYRQSK